LARRKATRLGHRRPGISPVIATLLLTVITITAAIVLYVFVSGLITGLTAGGPAALVTANGQMSVPGTFGNSGVLTLQLRNGNSKSISSVTTQCSTTYFSQANCSNQLSLLYNGVAISAANLLPPEKTSSGTALVLPGSVGSFTAGTTYTVLMSVTFVDGSNQIIDLDVTSTS